MSNPNTYSLWLIPTGEVHDRLSRLIDDLARQDGTPAFEPHVTLIGSAPGSEDQVLSVSRQLASRLRPFQLRTTGLGLEDLYFRSLYLKVRKSPAVMDANRRALELFSLPPADYMPHISLLYSDLAGSDKEPIVTQLQQLPTFAFRATSLHVVNTVGAVQSWRPASHFSIGPT